MKDSDAYSVPSQRGRNAIVTGANSGIGLAIASCLAAAGARVILACRESVKADLAANQILAHNSSAALEIATLDLADLPAAQSASPGSATWDWAVTSPVKLLGAPLATLTGTASGPSPTVDATIALRVWDVSPSGVATLVTRGVYRLLQPPGALTVSTELFGNGWSFSAGDTIRLQITQDDAPFLRPDNLPSNLTWSNADMTKPTRP